MLNRFDQSLGRLITGQLKEYWWFYVLAITSLFFTHRLQVELPFIAKELGELVLKGQAKETPYLHYVLIALGIVLFRTLSRVLFFLPARFLQGKLHEELIMRIETSPPWRYQSYSSGQLYQCLVTDIFNFRVLIGFALLQTGNIIIVLAVLFPRLIQFNPGLVVALTPLVVGACLFTVITTISRKFYRQMADRQGDVQNLIIESYEGKMSIKNFQAEKSFLTLFGQGCSLELQSFFKGSMGMVLSFPLVKICVGLSFLWGSTLIYTDQLGSTALILFSGFIFLLQGPLTSASWVGFVVGQSIGSWNRIKELIRDLEAKSKQETLVETLNAQAGPFSMNLWNVKSSFPFVQNGWNVVVGETGSGKSTLLEHYATLLRSRGEKLAYVSQEPCLYNETIAGNIFLGRRPEQDDIDLAKSLIGLFQLDVLASTPQAIMALPVGEDGKRISGGQAKRVCLIRSLLSKSDIFIWDDPFSSVDLILEKKIITQLKSKHFFNNKTLVLTSHRLSTVMASSEAFLLERNKGLVENGRVDDLLNNKTSKLYEHLEKQMV